MSYATESDAKDYEHHEMAIVGAVRFGLDDRCLKYPTLRMDFHMIGSGCLMTFSGSELARVLREAQCEDVTQLRGRPCVVHSRGLSSVCRFVRWMEKP